MAIKQLILHYLEKHPEQTTCTLRPRQAPLPITPELENLLQELVGAYNQKAGKAFGRFNSQSAEFSQALEQYLQGSQEFVSFSLQSAEALKTRFDEATLVSGGYLLFAHYQQGVTEYLLVALLSPSLSLSVNDQLEITGSEYLDLSRLNLAARINLSAWQGQTQADRYISWLKPRGGRRLADYFCQVLGVEEQGDSKQDTEQLVQAVSDYCSEQSEAQEGEETLKEKAVSFCKETASDEYISLEELSAYLNDEEPDRFARFVNTGDYDLAPQIKPEPRQMQRMLRYSGRDSGLSLSFDARLLGERLQFDAASGTLTIRGLPKGLLQQLQGQTPEEA